MTWVWSCEILKIWRNKIVYERFVHLSRDSESPLLVRRSCTYIMLRISEQRVSCTCLTSRRVPIVIASISTRANITSTLPNTNRPCLQRIQISLCLHPQQPGRKRSKGASWWLLNIGGSYHIWEFRGTHRETRSCVRDIPHVTYVKTQKTAERKFCN